MSLLARHIRRHENRLRYGVINEIDFVLETLGKIRTALEDKDPAFEEETLHLLTTGVRDLLALGQNLDQLNLYITLTGYSEVRDAR